MKSGIGHLLLVLTFSLCLHGFLIAQEQQTLRDVAELSLEDLLNVEITTASKKSELLYEAPGIVSVITRDEIEGFSGRHLGDILNRIPGAILLTANVFPNNSVEMRAQSFTPYNNHVLFLLNGRPFRDPISGGLNAPLLTGFPLDCLERIEVIRGPGSVLYGSCAYSGVINLVTKLSTHDGIAGQLGLNAGSQGIFSQSVTLNARKGDLLVLAALYHYDDRGPEFSFVDYLGVSGRSRFDRQNVSFIGSVQYKGLRINSAVIGLDQYNLAGADNNWDAGDPYDNNNHLSMLFDGEYHLELNEANSLTTAFTANRHIWETDGDETQYGNDLMAEMTFKTSAVNRLNMTLGGTLASSSWKGDKLKQGKLLQTSVYAQMDYKVNDRLKLIGGFQLNKIEGISANLSPRVGLIYSFSKNTGIKALYSKAFRKGYPLETSFDIDVFRGNLGLEPELIGTSELQFFFHEDSLQLNLTGYYSRMTNMIVRRRFEDANVGPLGWYLMYVNGGNHEFYGVELEGKGNLTRSLFAVGSFSIQGNRNDSDLLHAALHPACMVKLGLLYRGEGYDCSVYNSFFSQPYPVSLINSEVALVNPEAGGFNLLGARLDADLFRLFRLKRKDRIKVKLTADNILGKTVRYPEFTSRGVNTLTPLYAGIVVQAGLSYEF